jgi:hypothetical protein
MKGEFVIMIDGKLVTFNDFDQIPNKFQHVIKFLPDIPPPPHTEEQHKEIESHATKLQELLEIERRNYGS